MSKRRYARASILVLSLLPLVAGCLPDPVGSGIANPGDMTATLVSPNGNEGSAVLELTSGTILAITTPETYERVYGVPTAPGRIVIVRRDPGQITFRLVADDIDNPPEIRVVEVAGPDDVLRADLSRYSVKLTGGGS